VGVVVVRVGRGSCRLGAGGSARAWGGALACTFARMSGQRGLAAWEKRRAGRCVLRFAPLEHYSRVLVYRRCGSRKIRWAPPSGGGAACVSVSSACVTVGEKHSVARAWCGAVRVRTPYSGSLELIQFYQVKLMIRRLWEETSCAYSQTLNR